MHSAELRLEEALRAFRRAAFGDAEYHEEAKRVRVLDAMARHGPPPKPGVRARLNRLWAWNKRMRGR